MPISRQGIGKPKTSPSNLRLSLARRIVEVAKEQCWKAGRHLREIEIAEAFGVSRTPARAALTLLDQHGIVEARANHGFFLARDASAINIGDLSLPQAQDEDIRNAIVRDRAIGRISDNFTETEFQALYDIGRSALTRILMRLAEEGLIKRRRGHGWSFAPSLASPDARHESYRFRIMVECMALREPGFCINAASFAQSRAEHMAFLRDIDGGPSPERFFNINAAFHSMLAACSGNRFVLQAIEAQNALRKLSEYGGYSDLDREEVSKSCREHLAILDAIEAGDVTLAAMLMSRHLERAASLFARPSQAS